MSEGDEAERLREIERERLQALVTVDVAAFARLHHPDFQLVTPGGGVLSKETYLETLTSGEMRYLVFEADSPIETRLSGDMAALRYRSRLQGVYQDQPISLQGYWHTDIYERGVDGQWRAVWSQATRILE